MLEKISIQGPATFVDEVVLDNLPEVNFIYGANGSGKTTISNVIMNPSMYDRVSLEWKGGITTRALVYNKQFREQNFAPGVLPGVFTLGKATKEQLNEVENYRDELSRIKEEGIKKKTTLEKLQEDQATLKDEFSREMWKSAKKKYESVFNEAFKGNVKSMESFCDKVLAESDTNISELSDYDILIEESKVLLSQTPLLFVALPDFPDVKIRDIESSSLWQKVIVGSNDVPIAKMIQRLNMSDWVNEGKNYLNDDSDVCPFCQQHTIDAEFKSQLDLFFDQEYLNSLHDLSELIGAYQYASELLLSYMKSLIEAETINVNTKVDVPILRSQYEALYVLLKHNIDLMANKKKEPSRKVELRSTDSALNDIINHIAQANKKIDAHNVVVRNYAKERTALISRIWKFIVTENADSILEYKKKDRGLSKGIANLTTEVNSLRGNYSSVKLKLESANKNVTSIQSSIDEINRSLQSYGFTNFTIVPYDDHYYQVRRPSGEDANGTLSEGEVTFLTFLYFMQLVKGGFTPEEASDDRILVIDDPISSLDNTILFIVSSMIKELLKQVREHKSNVRQVIILTHNVYFHKEVTFVDQRCNIGNDTCFWILRKNKERSYIQRYGKDNPIRGSYELLWDELKTPGNHSIMTIQNTMRKIYETYFRILGRYDDTKVLSSFPDVQEKEICRSLLCWVNDGSHCVQDDFYAMPDADLVEKYKDVFKRIFEATNHIEHYNMMMGVEQENVN